MTHLTLHEEIYKTRIEYQKIKAERDTLIDDIAVLKANISRLERENEKLSSLIDVKDNAFKGADRIIKNQKHENKALRLQSNTYFDEWKNEKLTSQGLREQCKEYVQDASKYTTLTNHIRLKAENNPGVSRYIELVNYIDRLERANDER